MSRKTTADRKTTHNSRMRRYVSILLMAWVLLAGCNDSLVYSTFRSTPTNGWDKNEPLKFEVPPMRDEGNYNLSLGVRLSDDFPFRNLHVAIRQECYPSGEEMADTIIYEVVDQHGNINGQGVNYYQYEMPVFTTALHKGDSLFVTVKHIMKREILPGILDVGVIIENDNKQKKIE